MEDKTIHLEALAEIPSLPRGSHIAILQKCIVSFFYEGFTSGLILLSEYSNYPDRDNVDEKCFKFVWDETVDQTLLDAHADLVESVEDSAKAIALLLISRLTKYKVGRQSPRGTHIDYYLTDPNSELPFQKNDAACIEITGIKSGIEKVQTRINQKINRLHRERDFPTYIVCVEHSFPLAKIERVDP